ncbi:MAG: site-specific integrase [Ruminococcus sp.]|nr:site-specific integrase [Ruminococcus sp.]
MLTEITALQIQQFYNDKYNGGLTANTIKHYHANIHKALKYAIKMDLFPNNPSEKTELPKLKKFQANFYNAEELEEFFKAFKGDRLELVVNIAAYYGQRRSEVLGLKWDCIDFDRKKITIRRKLIYRMSENDDELVVEEELKTRASVRTLPLIPHIEAMLKERFFLEQYYSNLLKGDFDHTFDGFVCRDNFGKIITLNYTTQHFQIVLANNNLRRIRFHDLRHSCASLLFFKIFCLHYQKFQYMGYFHK